MDQIQQTKDFVKIGSDLSNQHHVDVCILIYSSKSHYVEEFYTSPQFHFDKLSKTIQTEINQDSKDRLKLSSTNANSASAMSQFTIDDSIEISVNNRKSSALESSLDLNMFNLNQSKSDFKLDIN